MKRVSVFTQYKESTKWAGMFAFYWSIQSCDSNNDHTPESTQGSREEDGYA